MTVKNAELEELVKEQTALQCTVREEEYGGLCIEDRTMRSRTLREYGQMLFDPCLGEEKFNGLLDNLIRKRGKAVWVDLGCGHAVALKEGKQYFRNRNVPLRKLRTYGYDAIPPAILRTTEAMDWKYAKYAPKIIQADIENVVFEEQPDLITAVCSLFWTRDPLQVFANAARQAKKGAVLCFNNINRITTDDYLYGNLFEKIISSNAGIPGFDVINLSNDAIVARKASNHKDYTYGFRLVSKRRDCVNDPFWYIYTSDYNSNGRKREF